MTLHFKKPPGSVPADPDLTDRPLREQWLTVPNLLTLIRLAAIPFMAVYILRAGARWTAFGLFVAIWATDVLDGFIARRFHVVTSVGKVLDPLTDKLFQLVSAVALCISGRLPLWVLILLLVNQALMVMGGLFLWRSGTVVHARWYGKLTTVLLTLAFAVLLIVQPVPGGWRHLLFVLPLALMYYSTIRYGMLYFKQRPSDL